VSKREQKQGFDCRAEGSYLPKKQKATIKINVSFKKLKQ